MIGRYLGWLVPKSLFGRLVLVLLAGLTASQLATFYINQTERDRLLFRAGGQRVAQQLGDLVQLLDGLPAPDRRRVAAVFNSPRLSVSLDRPPLKPSAEPAAEGLPAAALVPLLRSTLGPQARIVVEPRGSFRGGFGKEHGERMRGRGGPPAFTVQVPLADGTLVTFESNVLPPAGATTTRLLLTLAVLLGTVLLLSLVAVRWLTGPLSALAGAAEKLGEDIHRPPMPETGPAEVRRAARSFNAMQQRLARTMEERTRLLTAMSHDLRTPITRMRLRTELLEDEAVRQKFERDLAEMEEMVKQTLEFMRDATAAEPAQRVDLMALLEGMQADYEDTGREVTLEGRLSGPVPARPASLRRCLANLVDNALRYGKRATVRVAEAPATVSVSVLDEGPGIPEDRLEAMFEPFVRGEASRSKETGGFGLGLGIARNIARAHGGELVLKNRPEGGLAAILTLPRRTAKDA